MNKFLIIALLVQAVFASEAKQIRSRKLAPEFSQRRQSQITYRKDNNWFSSFDRDGTNEFYESEFSTRIDHFRPLNQQRVNFTYHVNANHFEDGGPIFINLKTEYDFSTQWIEEGLMVDIAEDLGAVLLTFDHRYFGTNLPFETASFEHLELLSVEQVLADVAEFIRVITRDLDTADSSRVILWGSGAGGTLATFARSRYPHLVFAAWSSSAILESAPYSWGPYDLFAYTFDINDEGYCRNRIEDAYEEIAALVTAGQGEQLGERMGLCHPVDTTTNTDVAALYENSILSVWYYFNNFHYQGVLDFCEDMDVEDNPLDSLARWFREVYGDDECFDPSYATAIERFSNTEWDQIGTNSGRRQWYFLQCTQVASFLIADEYTWLPGTIDFNYHLQKCGDLFEGGNFTYDTLTTAFYTLREEFTQVITNMIYTNGNLDPLRYFGRVYDPTNAGIVLNIDFAAKSADLTSLADDDAEPILIAKRRIIEAITDWVREEVPTEPPVTPATEAPEKL